MNYKRLLQCFTLILVTNIIALDNYYTKYNTDSLINSRLFQLKYRCYRYYDNDLNNDLINMICSPYKYDYVVFSLGRSRYIALCCGLNLILMFFSILFI